MTGSDFRQTIIPCYKSMYAAAFAIFRAQDDASDAVQETMARLWSQRDKISVPANPAAFCIRAVRNQCIDMLRTRKCEPLENLKIADSQSADAPANFHSSVSLVGTLIADFPKKQQKVLHLSFISQLSADEIAEITGLSNANVRQIISRGRQILKSLLSHEIII